MTTKSLAKAVNILKSGGVAIFPTDTVWGIGASIKSRRGIEKLYKVKNRPASKPTAVLIANLDQANQLGRLNQKTNQLANDHWPGAITLIVPSKKSVPTTIMDQSKTIGLRIPNHQLVTELCLKLGNGIVTASANFAGASPPKSFSQLDSKFSELADIIIVDEKTQKSSGQASTVVDLSQSELKILRQGAVRL